MIDSWSWPRFFRNAVIIAVLTGVGSWIVVESVLPNVFPKRFGVVVEGELYRSGRLTPAATRKVVQENGIRTIVDFGGFDKDPVGNDRAQRTADALGVRRIILPLEGDSTGDPNRYLEALRIIEDPDSGPVLMHCAAGSERTGCAVALYRMIEQDWPLDRAIDEATRYDHDPADNPQVRRMIETWRPEIERALRDGGAIDVSSPSDE